MLKQQPISWGSDPELFLSRKGQAVPSEEIIPKNGLTEGKWGNVVVVRDGVQVELNPNKGGDIPTFGQNIRASLEVLKNRLAAYPDVTIDWRGTIDVPMKVLDSLSAATRQLGCKPSLNYYGSKAIDVDPLTFQQRSAGGHGHFGLTPGGSYPGSVQQSCKELVPVLDYIAGNTCVLIDRDPRASERRINYGRAGEYRKPRYGVEYRTLSNFWLRSPVLYDLVFGLFNMALSTFAPRYVDGEDPEAEAAALVGNTIRQYQQAINTNDYNLARVNFDRIRPYFVSKLVPVGLFPIDAGNIDKFLTFTEGVRDKGLNTYFPDDPLVAWLDKPHQTFREWLEKL